eukprot:6198888-Pleurochrysis_carterae.AAC.3
MHLNIFGASGNDFSPAEAIVYAADNGAAIAQNSWGYERSGAYDPSVLMAIDYFNEYANSAGTPSDGGLVVFAAGNEASNLHAYPAFYSGTIAVAATDDSFKLTSYSNFGDWVDISAPGDRVLSTVPDEFGSYARLSGTSMVRRARRRSMESKACMSTFSRRWRDEALRRFATSARVPCACTLWICSSATTPITDSATSKEALCHPASTFGFTRLSRFILLLTGYAQAAPIVSGTLALFMSFAPKRTRAAYRDCLFSSAKDMAQFNPDGHVGWGAGAIGEDTC